MKFHDFLASGRGMAGHRRRPASAQLRPGAAALAATPGAELPAAGREMSDFIGIYTM